MLYGGRAHCVGLNYNFFAVLRGGGGVRVVHVLEVCSCTGISLPCNFIWLIHVLYALFVFIFNCF